MLRDKALVMLGFAWFDAASPMLASYPCIDLPSW